MGRWVPTLGGFGRHLQPAVGRTTFACSRPLDLIVAAPSYRTRQVDAVFADTTVSMERAPRVFFELLGSLPTLPPDVQLWVCPSRKPNPRPARASRAGDADHDTRSDVLRRTAGLFKTEVIRRRGPWKGVEDAEFATLGWVHWFNNRRLLEPLGNQPPVEFEAAYYREEEIPVAVAGLK